LQLVCLKVIGNIKDEHYTSPLAPTKKVINLLQT
jgi:hypothetical protein